MHVSANEEDSDKNYSRQEQQIVSGAIKEVLISGFCISCKVRKIGGIVMGISSSDISRYINEVQSELGRTSAGRTDSSAYAGRGEGDSGLFDTAEAAIEAALAAQKELMRFSLADREKFISAMRQAA